MTFNEKIKELRRLRGLTQKQASGQMGILHQNLAAYEEGRAKPPYDILKKIIEFYEIPFQDFYAFMFDESFMPKLQERNTNA